jgi:hypothetical protein
MGYQAEDGFGKCSIFMTYADYALHAISGSTKQSLTIKTSVAMSSITMSTMVLSLSIALLVLQAKALENSYSTKDTQIEDRYKRDESSFGWKGLLHGWMTMFDERGLVYEVRDYLLWIP